MSAVTGVEVQLARHGRVTITPGVLDDAARFAFTAGHCHALALAVHERTGWPMLGLSGRHSGYPDLKHVVVVLPDGRWLDINGPCEPYENLHQELLSAEEIQGMGRRKYWKNPQVEIARPFVEPLLDAHGLRPPAAG